MAVFKYFVIILVGFILIAGSVAIGLVLYDLFKWLIKYLMGDNLPHSRIKNIMRDGKSTYTPQARKYRFFWVDLGPAFDDGGEAYDVMMTARKKREGNKTKVSYNNYY